MARLVNCKLCKHKIAKTENICPNCGGKNKMSFIKKVFVMFPLFGIVSFGGFQLWAQIQRSNEQEKRYNSIKRHSASSQKTSKSKSSKNPVSSSKK